MDRFFNLSVPNPCKEKWVGFSKTNKGGFCHSCQKEVIDFTTWSVDDIKSHFKNRNSTTCGRFKAHQLSTYSIPNQVVRKNFSWLPISLISASLLLSSRDLSAQQQKLPLQKTTQFSNKRTEPNSLTPGTGKEITGTVKAQSDNLPLPGVNVKLKGTSAEAITDVEGRFTILIPNYAADNILVVSFIGLVTTEIAVNGRREFEIILKEDRAALDEIVITGGCSTVHWWGPRRTWWRIRNLFRRK